MLNQPAPSGIQEIDQLIGSLLTGDNVVWRSSSFALYRRVCTAVLEEGRNRGLPLIYFRFSNHPPLTDSGDVKIIHTKPDLGFEHFISEVHRVIRETGTGGIYLFDSLSDLQEMYFSDRMIGCFFELTCPYLRRMETIAYFLLNPSAHSRHALDPIRRTTQVWVDAYISRGTYYLSPLKTWDDPQGEKRSLYRWDIRGKNPGLTEILGSLEEARVRQSEGWNTAPATSTRQIDIWDTFFMRYQDLQTMPSDKDDGRDNGSADGFDKEEKRLRKIAERMILSSDPQILQLANRFMKPRDIIYLWKRMAGTGQIGGKALGMLLARAILREKEPELHQTLEEHDTFYIGSDVFYTFLVENGCWWERRRLHAGEGELQASRKVEEQMTEGTFPAATLKAFEEILEYYGSSPIIVRSSSLLEDNFGNAFAGKYESIFCANQGTPGENMEEFLRAVRRIYAGTLSSEALSYRRERGALDKDEQMALLVQRVSGRRRGSWFFPELAGIGLSYNPYVWHPSMDAAAGMSRLVIGLGTRAVDRTTDDNARIVPHDSPERQPGESPQNHLDALNLETGRICAVPLRNPAALEMPEILQERDWRREKLARERGWGDGRRIGLEAAVKETPLAASLQKISRCLEGEYGTPVEFEFTAQWEEAPPGRPAGAGQPAGSVVSSAGDWRINIVQCRPFQFNTGGGEPLPEVIPAEGHLIQSRGALIGQGRFRVLDALVWVEASDYTALSEEKRYGEAERLGRVIGELRSRKNSIFLFGPGRWGTSTPSMGVPVKFSQIRGVTVLGELDWMHASLSPDLSLGTHFFHDLVEDDILYVALPHETSIIHWEELKKRARKDGSLRILKPGPHERFRLLADPGRREFLVYTEET